MCKLILNRMNTDKEFEDKITFNVKARDLANFAHTLAEQILIGTAKKTYHISEVYLTTDELCKKLSISRVTAWNWEKKGILNPIKFGTKKRYKLSDLEKLTT